MRSLRRCPALLLLMAVAAAGCTHDRADAPVPPAATASRTAASKPVIEKYVALGDSFTAGPYVPSTDLANGCFRSNGNYPSLVAERLDVEQFTDVSCSGASTRHLVEPQRPVPDAKVPPQLEAVDRDTDLVTMGIGGNDFDVFATLLRGCMTQRTGGSPCADRLAESGIDLTQQTEQVSERVTRAIRQVKRRAPDATVLLVGYLRLAPEEGRCPHLLPLTAGDYAVGGRVEEALNRALHRAARRAGVSFVDMHVASRGHDVCSEEPWVNGQRTDQSAAFAFHPFAAGMEAVADRIVTRLS